MGKNALELLSQVRIAHRSLGSSGDVSLTLRSFFLSSWLWFEHSSSLGFLQDCKAVAI